MATTTARTGTKIVVNAQGLAAGGANAHFKLLIDGVAVGEGTAGTAAKDFTFTTTLDADTAHKVQIQYDNDAYINGQDRTLTVNRITIGDKTVSPTDSIVSYDRGALDGRDVVAGQKDLWWNGTLVVNADKSFFPAPAITPASGLDTIVVNAQGTAAGGVNAHFKLLVDGKAIGEGTAGTTARDFTFTTDATAGAAHKVQIQYDNDAVVNGQDRSLTVNKITVNGHGYAPTDSAVTYDKGVLDGKDVVPGQAGMWWNGTLVVNAPASDFPAGTTPTTPATPANPLPTGPAFYVATNGKDSWSGKLAAPNADGTDGPFASLAKAQSAMRADTTIDTTYVRGGDYYLKNGLWLDGQDSGVRFAAYGSETPVIHGGSEVTGWVSRGNGLWSAQLPAGTSVLDLTMDGVRQTAARTPNADPNHPIDGGWLIAQDKAGLDPTTQFAFKDGDIPVYASTKGMMVNIFGKTGYDAAQVAVKSIDYANHVVTLESGNWNNLGAGSRFYLYNGKDQLDATSEWAYDSATNQLLFKPAGGTPLGHEVTTSNVNVLIGMGGAKNVTIEGLTLTNGAPAGHAVYAENAAGLTFKNNHVSNTGYGITVQNSTNATVTGNSFDHTGREAVFVKMGSHNTVVSNNAVSHAGSLDSGGDAVWINGSSDVQVTHNYIEHTGGKAIAVGSVDGASDAAYRDVIAYNKVVGSNLETSDGGGIYVINRQQDAAGHIVEYNDVSGTTAFGNVTWDGAVSPTFLAPEKLVSWGIYLDDWTSGTTVRGNYVHGNVGGVFLHGGWSNTVTDNLIAGNTGAQIGLQQSVGYGGWKGTPMANNDISGNVIDTAKGIAVHLDGPASAGKFHDNEYTSLNANARLFEAWPQVMASGSSGTLKNWQAAGYDSGSEALDAHFVNPAAGNYTLAADSPVYQHGFDVLPFDQMGLLHA